MARCSHLAGGALATLLAAGCGAARPVTLPLYLAAVPTRSHHGSLGRATPLSVDLYPASDPAAFALAIQSRFPAAASHGDHLRVHLERYVPSAADSPDAYRQASFVIDYDDPAFGPVRERITAAYGAQPDVETLVRFASEYIARKGTGRGYDIASEIARRGEGDCTEHAVFLAALLRVYGYPARVVHGILLFEVDEQVIGVGHAWVETGDGGTWRGVDATQPERAVDRRYIALGQLRDEGPAFLLDIGGMPSVRLIEVE